MEQKKRKVKKEKKVIKLKCAKCLKTRPVSKLVRWKKGFYCEHECFPKISNRDLIIKYTRIIRIPSKELNKPKPKKR